jgi:hypothetical protein
VVTDLDDVLFKYVSRSNPKSNEDLKRFLRLYPLYREEIIEFTATWRALSILEWVKPPPDPVDERQLMRHAKVHLRTLQRHRTSKRREDAKGQSRIRKRCHAAWAK